MLFFILVFNRLFLEEILYFLIGYHLLIEDVSTCLGALNHLDHFCISATILRSFVEGSNGFLCHILLLFNFFVNSHFLEDGVVFLQLHTLRCVLAVFGRHIATCAWQTAILHLGALKNHLHSIAFSFL